MVWGDLEALRVSVEEVKAVSGLPNSCSDSAVGEHFEKRPSQQLRKCSGLPTAPTQELIYRSVPMLFL